MKDPLYLAIERHWREHRPRMVQSLEAKGRLSQAVEFAATRHSEATSSLLQQGVPPMQAEDLTREVWAFLPAEADVPELRTGRPRPGYGSPRLRHPGPRRTRHRRRTHPNSGEPRRDRHPHAHRSGVAAGDVARADFTVTCRISR